MSTEYRVTNLWAEAQAMQAELAERCGAAVIFKGRMGAFRLVGAPTVEACMAAAKARDPSTAQNVVKLGRDLQVGDVIAFWSFDAKGARIYKLTPYAGPLRNIVCALADLKGAHWLRGDGHTLATSIEADMAYTVLPN